MYRVRTYLCGATLVAAMSIGSAAGAVSLTSTKFDRGQADEALATMQQVIDTTTFESLHIETFEDHQAWNGTSGTSSPQNTKVGSFNAKGGSGSGHSVINGGHSLEVRDDNSMAWGRYNTRNGHNAGATAGNWLDSNDNQTMEWKIEGLGKFDTISFFVIDAADVGGKFSIKVGETMFSDLAGGERLKNGNIQFVQIALDAAVDELTIEMGHHMTNDGFGVDGMMVGQVATAPIPVPPAAALMLTGMLSLAGLRRRRRAANA